MAIDPGSAMPLRLFVGIGSPHGDDAAGWAAADALAVQAPAGLEIQKVRHPLDLLDLLEGPVELRLCDACQGLGAPGQWRRWEWPRCNAVFERSRGSHDFSLPAALALAERLGKLFARPIIWGIELERCESGAPLTEPVARAVREVADDVVADFTAQREST